MNDAALEEPAGVVTTTSTAPAACAGVTTVSSPSFVTERLVPSDPSKVTLVAPVKCVPVIVTEVPPSVEPLEGDTSAIAGAGVTYVNDAALEEPAGVVTTTSTAPATCAGVTTVSSPSLVTDRPEPAEPSNVTDVAPVRCVPVMVTEVPPSVEPDVGDTSVIAGAGVTYVNDAAN